MSEIWDIIVVGGGAAGFFGAIASAQAASESVRILIVERSARVLQKVKISGGGRCNVTHDCFEPMEMASRYPRGNKALIGPLYRFGVRETIRWFENRGVSLKTEADGRIFPVTDDSQTIVDCLQDAAKVAGIEIRTRCLVQSIQAGSDDGEKKCAPGARQDAVESPENQALSAQASLFSLAIKGRPDLLAKRVLVATGGTRLATSRALPGQAGHQLAEAVPSLFTFKIDHPVLEGMQGVVVEPAMASIKELDFVRTGPLLITHWGLSGPVVLELSAWGARELAQQGYDFTITIDWMPGVPLDRRFHELRQSWGARQVASRSPFDSIPKRLWQRLVEHANVPASRRWAEFSTAESERFTDLLHNCQLPVRGQTTHKDEFVTCGGVVTDDLDMRTMGSAQVPGLYFAGEVVNIDGITGGYNFQNAWTTGYLAGQAMAASL